MFNMYRKMYLIRKFEQKAIQLYWEGINRGALHTYIGEEAVAVGVCSALEKGDYVSSTHRGHGHCLAMNGDPRIMLAELLGKENGYCKGRGGSMHIADLDLGVLGANGIVGGGIPIAVGAALALDYKNTKKVVACFFGDGATSTGAFHEALNLASVWKLPIIFICENNLYAISTCVVNAVALEDLAHRADAYGMKNKVVDGNDVLQVYEEARKAREMVLTGEGPVFLECKTYRTEGHWVADPQIYRQRTEIEEWKKKCPIAYLKKNLIHLDPSYEKELYAIEQKVDEEIKQAESFAKNSPEPDPKDVLHYVLV
ncbi:MAG: thiamine pyrophosphate-dependent dehydrogenase E1 component subunit alpha [Candidatus Atribacteria bacterium]|nr:thiamine pyrophosphate-dependent dehydrogenase E1 component subunit alpha [Candidatus Atribacteria bacterium]